MAVDKQCAVVSLVEVEARCSLVSKLDSLKHLVCSQLPGSILDGHLLWQLCAPLASPIKHGATLLAQLARNHANRADTPLTRSISGRE